jgi:hypothetical protein
MITQVKKWQAVVVVAEAKVEVQVEVQAGLLEGAVKVVILAQDILAVLLVQVALVVQVAFLVLAV